MKKCMPKYNIGGVLKNLSGIAGLVPAIGPVLAPAMSIVGGIIESEENKAMKQEPVPTKINYTNNPYSTFRHGGEVSGYKQYDAPTHEEGGQPIDENGNVNFSKPVAEIEGTENKYTYSQLPDKQNNSYVFSDQNGTSQVMDSIMKKYKNKNVDKDFLAKTAMELEIKQLEKVNNLIKEANQPKEEMSGGGGLNVITMRKEEENQEYLREMPDGGDPEVILGRDMGNMALNPKFNRMGVLQPIPSNIVKPLDINVNTNVSPPPTTNTFNMPNITSGNISDVLKGALAIGDVVSAATAKPDAVDPRLADYTKSDNKMYSVNTDMSEIKNQALAANNQAVQNINDNTLSQSQRMSRLSGVYSNFGETLSNIALQEQQQRNNYSVQQGQYEANKAQDNANRLTMADEKFSMNQAAARQLKDVARQTVSSFAQDLAEKQFDRDRTKYVFEQARLKTADSFAILNKMVTDFGLTGSKEWNDYLKNPSSENLDKVQNSVKVKMK